VKSTVNCAPDHCGGVTRSSTATLTTTGIINSMTTSTDIKRYVDGNELEKYHLITTVPKIEQNPERYHPINNVSSSLYKAKENQSYTRKSKNKTKAET
jgi:hypothetical protein